MKTPQKDKVASVLARLRNIAAERSLSFNFALRRKELQRLEIVK